MTVRNPAGRAVSGLLTAAHSVSEMRSRYVAHAGILYVACRPWSLIALGCIVLRSAAIVTVMVATGRLVGNLPAALREGFGSAAADRVWLWFAVFAGLNVGAQIVDGVVAAATARVSAAYLEYVLGLIAEAGTWPPDLALLDSDSYPGRIRAVLEQSRNWMFRLGINATWLVLRSRLVGLGSLAVLVVWRWWTPLIVVLAFASLSWTFRRVVDAFFDAFFSRQLAAEAIELRQARYMRELLSRSEAAKEVRLFGLSGWLVERYRALWRIGNLAATSRRYRAMLPVLWASLTVMAALALGLGALAHDAADGAISVAMLITLVQAMLALEAFGIVDDGEIGLSNLTATLRELESARIAAGLPGLRPGAATPRPHRAASGAARVEFDDVAFTYPTRDAPTLAGLTLTIPAGQSIAIVGVNGAGKSTLIKLLGGLYPLDHGSVLIDGVDPHAEPGVRRRVAVIFQDFVRYPLSLRDNVGFGAIERCADQEVLDRALRAAGGESILDRLGGNWETILSAEFDGGTDLSGGQWQRVALARALAAVAAGAGVLVLDEPTAALDVRAEAALFDRFLQATRDVTTILVSHRLSSVRHADRIVVLDGRLGRIVEDGSHDELMHTGGQYARLFTLQAQRFMQAGRS